MNANGSPNGHRTARYERARRTRSPIADKSEALLKRLRSFRISLAIAAEALPSPQATGLCLALGGCSSLLISALHSRDVLPFTTTLMMMTLGCSCVGYELEHQCPALPDLPFGRHLRR